MAGEEGRRQVTDSVLEDIAQNVLTTLATVTTSNDYENTLTVSRLAAAPMIPDDNRVYVFQGVTTKQTAPVRHYQWLQQFVAVAYVIEADSSSTPIDSRLNSIVGDIGKALMIDPTRGGFAIDTIIEGAEPFLEDDGGMVYHGTRVVFDVSYKTLDTNPFSAS